MRFSMRSLRIFLQFLHRDFFINAKSIKDNAINYALLCPITFGIQTAYLQANTYFGSGNITLNTALFSGTILLIMLMFTYTHNVELLFDLENKRYIDYQITILNPFLVLLERILFSSLLTFAITIPFYPVASLILPNYIDTSNASWIRIFILLYLGSLCTSAYHLFIACFLTSNSVSLLWGRVNSTLLMFGGFWISWNIMYQYSPILGYCAYINPLLYISEGIKGALIGNDQYLPFALCVPMLLIFSAIFTLLCRIAFKRRVDCL